MPKIQDKKKVNKKIDVTVPLDKDMMLNSNNATSTSKVTVNKWFPHTDQSIYEPLAKAGYLGHGADSLTMDQWKQMPPMERTKFLGPELGGNGMFDYTVGNTANPGGIKFWEKGAIPSPNGQAMRRSPVLKASFTSGDYFDAKKNTEYPLPELGFGSWLKENASGLLQGAGSLASMIPGIGTIAGPILSVAGAAVAGSQEKKQMLNDRQSEIDLKMAADKKLAYNNDVSVRNQNLNNVRQMNYAPTFAAGGDLMMGNNEMMNPQIIEYSDKADKHGEGIGGVPVDVRGNPSTTSKSSAIALTEGGEVTWNGYVFSNKLKVKK